MRDEQQLDVLGKVSHSLSRSLPALRDQLGQSRTEADRGRDLYLARTGLGLEHLRNGLHDEIPITHEERIDQDGPGRQVRQNALECRLLADEAGLHIPVTRRFAPTRNKAVRQPVLPQSAAFAMGDDQQRRCNVSLSGWCLPRT